MLLAIDKKKGKEQVKVYIIQNMNKSSVVMHVIRTRRMLMSQRAKLWSSYTKSFITVTTQEKKYEQISYIFQKKIYLKKKLLFVFMLSTT